MRTRTRAALILSTAMLVAAPGHGQQAALGTCVPKSQRKADEVRCFIVVDHAIAPLDTSERRFSPQEKSLMQADRDFATATHSRGIDGWMSFFAPDAVRLRYRGDMVKGFDAIRRFDNATISDSTTTLNWEPIDAHAFRDGKTGSTTGKYWVVSRNPADAGKELGHGRYVTMWRRDGGRWVVIMDTGYPEP
jgi:ketosteroid isomerase-like protein